VRSVSRVAIVVVALVLLTSCSSGSDDDRQATVASVGAQVMPFDLERTTHSFDKTTTGGTQIVTADDPQDVRQIDLIRAHLREEQVSFSSGDYSDPARIHGMDMPGVSELASGYQGITVTYRDEPAGGRLTYETSDPALIDAIHRWFDRQVMDHGDHARAGVTRDQLRTLRQR
jgi:hypothetical protein